MKAKEYLKQVELLDVKIRQKQQEYDELKEMALSTGAFDYSSEKVQTSVSQDLMGNKVGRYVDLEREIKKDIRRYTKLKNEIITQIQSIGNTKYMNILYKRYVEYKRLKTIADEMNYTYEYIRSMHGWALEEFSKKILNL